MNISKLFKKFGIKAKNNKKVHKEMQRLLNEGELLIAMKKAIQISLELSKYAREESDKTLNALNNYLNRKNTENKYDYIYICNKNEIQKFPEEIKDRKGDYYIGDFVFNDGCGFTKYKVHANEYKYHCEYYGQYKGSGAILDIYLQYISESMYIYMVKNLIDQKNDIVVLLEKGNVVHCIYSNRMITEKKLDRKDGIYCFSINHLISCFMPYLKSGKLKVIREVD